PARVPGRAGRGVPAGVSPGRLARRRARGVVPRPVPGVVRLLDDVPVGDLPRRVGMGVRAGRGPSRPGGRPGRGGGGVGTTQRARAGGGAGDRGVVVVATGGDGRGPVARGGGRLVRVLRRPHRRSVRVPHHQVAVAGGHVRGPL